MSETSALRLFFHHEAGRIRLASVQPIETRAPPHMTLDSRGPRRGSWLELKDGEDRVLYRRVTSIPALGAVEAPTGDAERPLSRAILEERRPAGMFALMVPDDPRAEVVELFGSTDDREAAASLGRFALAEAPRGGPPGPP